MHTAICMAFGKLIYKQKHGGGVRGIASPLLFMLRIGEILCAVFLILLGL